LEATQGKARGFKIVSCICFLLIAVALLLIDRHSPATGFELSVYESLPITVWIFLIAALAGGIGIIVHQALAGSKSKYWLLGFCLFMFVTSIVLLLPIFKGYYLYGSADTAGHSGWAGQVVREGHFFRGSQYPITSILMGQLAQVTGVSPQLATQFTPVLFTVLFMIFSYLLATSVLPKKEQALLAAATTTLFFNYYHVCVYPQTLCMMILPMVFYLYFKGIGGFSMPFRVAFVLVLLLFPFFHPAPAAVLIACFVAAEVARAVWKAREGTRSSLPNELIRGVYLEPTLISSVTFITWISSFEVFGTTIRRTLGWLNREIEKVPHAEILEETLEEQGMAIQQQVEIGLKMYGDNMVYLSLTAIALLIVAWCFLRRRPEARKLFVLSLPFLITGPVWVLVFTTTLRVTVGRLLGANIMMWAVPAFAAFALYEMFGRWKRLGLIMVTSVVLCTSVLGILGVYHSPYIMQVSWQVTHQDVAGSRWFKTHAELPAKNWYAALGVPVIPGGHTVGRIHFPGHFGYPEHETVGSLGLSTDLVIGERMILGSAHPTLARTTASPPHLFRSGFSPADFERLEADPYVVAKLYSNGELDVVRVRAQR
jgi:hypothetical protein